MVTDEKGSTCESRQPPAKEKSWSFWFKACGVGKSHTTRGQKCSKWDSRNILEATWPTEARSVQNEVPGTFWKPLGHRRPEQFNISLQTPSGSHMANGGQNTSPCPGLGGPAANKWTPAYIFSVFNYTKHILQAPPEQERYLFGGFLLLTLGPTCLFLWELRLTISRSCLKPWSFDSQKLKTTTNYYIFAYYLHKCV